MRVNKWGHFYCEGSIRILISILYPHLPQDTQEFLRCFMDQIHEELKVPVVDNVSAASADENRGTGNSLREDASSSSLSEIEYETCDSGLSSGLRGWFVRLPCSMVLCLFISVFILDLFC